MKDCESTVPSLTVVWAEDIPVTLFHGQNLHEPNRYSLNSAISISNKQTIDI